MDRLRHLGRIIAALLGKQQHSQHLSRLFRGEITDSASRDLRRIIEIVSISTGAPLFLFGVGVVCVIILNILSGSQVFGIFLLFSILIFYYLFSRTQIRLKEEENRGIVLRLAETSRAPQLRLPLGDSPNPIPRQRRPRRRNATHSSDRLPGL